MSASTAAGAMDAIALNLFEQLQGMTEQDRRFILIELDGHIAGAAGERVVLVRSALDLFVRETGEPLRRQRYEHWRVARADADALPSAAFIVGTWNGSWGNAVDELGLVAAPDQIARLMLVRGVSPTTTQLLDVLDSCATELGRTPTLRDFRLWKRDVSRRPGGPVVYSQQTYHEHFGGVAAGAGRCGTATAWPCRMGEDRWLDARRRDRIRASGGRRVRREADMRGVRRVAPAEARRGPHRRGAHAGAQRTVHRQVLRRMDCRCRCRRTGESGGDGLVSTVCSATPRSTRRLRASRVKRPGRCPAARTNAGSTVRPGVPGSVRPDARSSRRGTAVG
ncbi:MAG: hypothetical protein QOK16_1830 [Solirubrobacteraceae bacterium]|nr:hypothetical protein [Solirubrobacteraceae bacterium]